MATYREKQVKELSKLMTFEDDISETTKDEYSIPTIANLPTPIRMLLQGIIVVASAFILSYLGGSIP